MLCLIWNNDTKSCLLMWLLSLRNKQYKWRQLLRIDVKPLTVYVSPQAWIDNKRMCLFVFAMINNVVSLSTYISFQSCMWVNNCDQWLFSKSKTHTYTNTHINPAIGWGYNMSKMTIRKTQSNTCFQIDICVCTMVVCEQFAWNNTQLKLNQLGTKSHSQHTQVHTSQHTHPQSTYRFPNICQQLITLRHNEVAAHNTLRRANYKQLGQRK